MAREVGYFQDCEPNDPIYDEGPFVICNPLGNGWRIEQRGKTCPVLPDIEVYDILKRKVS